MNKDDQVYLHHILDAITQIKTYVKGVDYETFKSNRMLQDAVVRQLEIVGEASKNISMEIRSKHSVIAWRDLVGMRDKLIHHYFGIDLSVVWKTVKQDIPSLESRLQEFLRQS
ncbi:MAG: DUF86 domain-containing protein [Nitrospirae bacterium]|nr:DUF86 domain-containing protein [Nitrospirota bacterium]MBF0592398.1 DUF86 domain-containing protein [Nitrospirota bacterium]